MLAGTLGLLLSRVHGVIASMPGFDMLGIVIYSFVDHLLRLIGTAAIVGLLLGPASTSALRWPVCIGGFLAMSVGVDLLSMPWARGELDLGMLALGPLGLAVCPPAAWLGLESSPATKWRAAVDEWLNDAFVVMAFGAAPATSGTLTTLRITRAACTTLKSRLQASKSCPR